MFPREKSEFEGIKEVDQSKFQANGRGLSMCLYFGKMMVGLAI
jgi:hypothetical protein